MTYSIVARDPVTGELGVAVQSGTFGVGTVVPWLRPGVGAVATQAIAEPAYGPRCLDALAAGSSATEALEAAAAADAAAFLRQVGVVAADGTVAAVTGGGCIDHAGPAGDLPQRDALHPFGGQQLVRYRQQPAPQSGFSRHVDSVYTIL